MAYNKLFYWSQDDNAFITNVPALPGCMADGDTIDKSLKNADVMIQEWVRFAQEPGREIPQEDFSYIESTAPTSIDVASYILDRLDAIDTWMLQKLVYYCQAWCLGIYKTPFINDSFKDYANGPVNKRLFDTHRSRRIVKKCDYPVSHVFSPSEIRGDLKEGASDNKDIPEALMMEYYHN